MKNEQKIGKSWAIDDESDFEYGDVNQWINTGDEWEDLPDDGGFLRSKKRAVLNIKEGKKRAIMMKWHSFRIDEEGEKLFFKIEGDEKEWSTDTNRLGYYIHHEMRD